MENYLTEKQQRVLSAIGEYFDENFQSPTLSELCIILGIKTKRGVVKHLEALERKGFITRLSRPRGIFPKDRLDEYSSIYDIPVLGYANAGTPLVFAKEEQLGTLKISKNFVKDSNNVFALIIKGDSMNQRKVGTSILADKNYALIKKTDSYQDGDVVLAVIDNAATIKTLKRKNNSIILYPESNNPNHQPIYLDNRSEAFINGKVIGALESPMN